MNLLVVICSFAFGFVARLFQLCLQASSMVGSSPSFEPYGEIWCLLSSCVYGLVCLFVTLAATKSAQKSITTSAALLIAGGLLLADFAKPSRFEEGTYLDHAIHNIGAVQADAVWLRQDYSHRISFETVR
jgi:hypothetical protein